MDKSSTLAAFGPRLKNLRIAYGRTLGGAFTAADMAALIGIAAERYRTYERGFRDPPLWVIAKVKQLTGASLDVLIAGVRPDMPQQSWAEGGPGPTLGDRLRWVRELKEPNPAIAASVMGVPTEVWLSWEHDIRPMPLAKLDEFAMRFSVSIDFLHAGRLLGIQPELLDALLTRHPELARALPSNRLDARRSPAQNAGGNGKEAGANNSLQRDSSRPNR